MRSVYILSNPTARGGPTQLDAVVAAFARFDVHPTVLAVTTAADARAAAQRAVSDGASRLIAVGGDGMVHLAVNAVAESETVLGVVPLGTGNDFARALGLLDGDIDEQVGRTLAEPTPVDAIRTDGGWVASVATLGFSGDVTARANRLSWPRGRSRYTLATMFQLPRLRTLLVTVEIDGRRVAGATTLLAIGNTGYFGGGMRICPAARADDGRLHVVSIGDVPRRTFLRVFPTVFSGRHINRPEVTVDAGENVMIDGVGVDVWADGEQLGSLPMRFEVVPSALLVAGARAGYEDAAR